MSSRKLAVAFSFACATYQLCLAQVSQSPPVEAATAVNANSASEVIPENLVDRGFTGFVSAKDIRDALESLDARLMTDHALALAEGERILMREHRAGLTSAGLMETAANIAIQMGDKDSLLRLAKAAKAAGNDVQAATFEVASQTAGASRAGEPDMGSAAYIVWAIRQATVRGDQEQIRWLMANLPSDLTREQIEFLKKLSGGSRSTDAGESSDTDRILSQLSATARPSEELFDLGNTRNRRSLCNRLGVPQIASILTMTGSNLVPAGRSISFQIALNRPANRRYNTGIEFGPVHSSFTPTPSQFVTVTRPPWTKCEMYKTLTISVAPDAPIGSTFSLAVHLTHRDNGTSYSMRYTPFLRVVSP